MLCRQTFTLQMLCNSVPRVPGIVICVHYRIAGGLTIGWDMLQQTLCKIWRGTADKWTKQWFTLKGKYYEFTHLMPLVLFNPFLIYIFLKYLFNTNQDSPPFTELISAVVKSQLRGLQAYFSAKWIKKLKIPFSHSLQRILMAYTCKECSEPHLFWAVIAVLLSYCEILFSQANLSLFLQNISSGTTSEKNTDAVFCNSDEEYWSTPTCKKPFLGKI